jgi:hypothetical protein
MKSLRIPFVGPTLKPFMKIWFVIGSLALALTTFAQEKPASNSNSNSQPEILSPRAPAQTTVNTNILATPGQKPKEPAIKFSGVATDFKRSTNRWKFFSLRAPRDPKRDGQNVVRDLRTEGGGGIKLFSVDF